MNKLNVLSCFDGIGVGYLALKRAGIEIESYSSSEIDKYALKIARKNEDLLGVGHNYLGNICDYQCWNLPEIDLIIGGSPRQGFSRAGEKLNFTDPRSILFFTFIRILERYKPKYFLLENVKMKSEWSDVISSHMGIEPVEINSSLFSAQSRGRMYWTNIPFDKNVQDKKILFKDILQQPNEVDEKYYLSSTVYNRIQNLDNLKLCGTGSYRHEAKERDKAVAILARDYKGVPGFNDFNLVIQNGKVRKLTPIEYERLQTLPDNYTQGISDTQRYKALGNSWTCDVISHIFKGLK